MRNTGSSQALYQERIQTERIKTTEAIVEVVFDCKKGDCKMKIKCTVEEFQKLIEKEPHNNEALNRENFASFLNNPENIERIKSRLFDNDFLKQTI